MNCTRSSHALSYHMHVPISSLLTVVSKMKQDVALYLFYRVQWTKQKWMIQAELCLIRIGRRVVSQELCTHIHLVLV